MPAAPAPGRMPRPVVYLRPVIATHPSQTPRVANVAAYRAHMKAARAVRIANLADMPAETLTLPLHHQVPSGRQPLELIPMDDIPRRAVVPPCRQKPAEPCSLAVFLIIVIALILGGSGLLIVVFGALFDAINAAATAWQAWAGA